MKNHKLRVCLGGPWAGSTDLEPGPHPTLEEGPCGRSSEITDEPGLARTADDLQRLNLVPSFALFAERLCLTFFLQLQPSMNAGF